MEYLNELDASADSGSSDDDDSTLVQRKTIPKDNYHIVKITFALLGCITLLPWNFIVTPSNYWNFKFRNSSSPFVPGSNSRTHLQVIWEAYVSVASNVPVAVACFFNVLLGPRFKVYNRIFGCCCVMLIIFIVLTSLVKTNSDSWIYIFFDSTLVLVFLLNGASGLFQGAIGGLVSKFSSSYISILYVGQAVCGVLASVIEILVTWAIDDPLNSALLYFIIADLIIVVAWISFIISSKTEYYTYTMNKTHGDDLSLRYRELTKEQKPPICDGSIVWKLRNEALTVFLTFVVTLSVFPSIVVLVEPTNVNDWTDKYFRPVVCFLLLNSGDLAGRLSANWIRKPSVGSNILPLLAVLRAIFIPLFMICNVQPRNSLPVILNSDLAFICLVTGLGLSNGYIANSAFIHAPMKVPSLDKERAGSVMVLFTVLATSLGSILSNGIINLV